MENKKELIKTISKDVAKQGIKMFFVMLVICILFVGFNLLFLIFANIERTIQEGIEYKIVLIELLVGIVFTVVAIVLTKKYLLFNTVSLGYRYLSPFFQKLSVLLFENIYDKGVEFTKKDKLSKVINVGLIWNESYNTKVPNIVQKGVNLLLNRIPFADLIADVNAEIKHRKLDSGETNKTVVTNMLYEQIDIYIQQKIFANNHFYNTFLLLLVNVLVQFGVAYFYINVSLQ